MNWLKKIFGIESREQRIACLELENFRLKQQLDELVYLKEKFSEACRDFQADCQNHFLEAAAQNAAEHNRQIQEEMKRLNAKYLAIEKTPILKELTSRGYENWTPAEKQLWNRFKPA